MKKEELKKKFDRRIITDNYSKKTIKAYWGAILQFINYCKNEGLEDYSKGINDFIQYLMVDRELSPSTVKQYGSAIIYLYTKVLNKKIPYIPLPKSGCTKPPVVLSRNEVFSSLEQLSGTDRLQAEIIYGCGLRISEGCKLRIKDIDIDYRQVIIANAKGQKNRSVPLPVSLIPKITNYIEKIKHLFQDDLENKRFTGAGLPKYVARKYPQYGKSFEWQFLFPSAYLSKKGERWHRSASTLQKKLKKAYRSAGIIKNATTHTLRHSWATHQLAMGTDIRVIQTILGHKSISTTMIYTHVTEKDVQAAKDLLQQTQTTIHRLTG